MVVSALVVTGLLAFSGNNIVNTGTLESGRSALYASEGAIQVAMWNSRYTYPSSLAASFCPSNGGQSTDPFAPGGSALDGQSVIVTCSAVTFLGQDRVLTFSAYPASQCQATCTGTPYIQAQVTYNDIGGSQSGSNNMLYKCNSTTNATCGTGMAVDTWVVEPGLT